MLKTITLILSCLCIGCSSKTGAPSPRTSKADKNIVHVSRGTGAGTSKAFTVKGECRITWEGRGARGGLVQPFKKIKGKWVGLEPHEMKNNGPWGLYSANGGTFRIKCTDVTGPWKVTVYKLSGRIE